MTNAIQRVGILADDGLPTKLLFKIFPQLISESEQLTQKTPEDRNTQLLSGQFQSVTVEGHSGSLQMEEDGTIDLVGDGSSFAHEREWDRLIYITDLPVSFGRTPVATQASDDGLITMICVPALGAVGMVKRLKTLIEELLSSGTITWGRPIGAEGESVGADDAKAWAPDTSVPSIRLVTGNVRSNQPRALVSALSSSLALALATGCFGLFYGSIWQLSAYVSPLRLFIIAFAAWAMLTAWLIFYNGMWYRTLRSDSDKPAIWRARVDNLATVGTVGIAALIIYFAAFTLLIILSIVIIPDGFLASSIGDDPNPGTYISIAGLGASMGALSGALGSNFDGTVRIRSSTYSEREYQRRLRSGYYDED